VVVKRCVLIALMVLAGVSLSSCATTSSFTSVPPLPENVQIVPPDPNLPPEIKAFSGKWSGQWHSQRNPSALGVEAVLVVEEIPDERHARIVYATGNQQRTLPKTLMETVDISKDEMGVFLSFSSSANATIKFRISGNGDKLEGIWRGPVSTFEVTMERIQ
jgi:hypothetical protein